MFEVYIDKSGEFRFRLKAKNGQIILASEGYTQKQGCYKGIESVKKHATDENNFHVTITSSGKYKFNLKAANGQIIGTSEMYESESGCKNGVESVMKYAPDAEVKKL